MIHIVLARLVELAPELITHFSLTALHPALREPVFAHPGGCLFGRQSIGVVPFAEADDFPSPRQLRVQAITRYLQSESGRVRNARGNPHY